MAFVEGSIKAFVFEAYDVEHLLGLPSKRARLW